MNNADELIQALVSVLSNTQGWQLVVIFLLYAAVRVYIGYTEDRKLRIIESTIASVLGNMENMVGNMENMLRSIDRSIAVLAARIEGFLEGVER